MGWQDHLFDASDPYIDPATGILRNLVHATTQEQLDEREAGIVTLRSTYILLNGRRAVRGTHDLTEIERIHRILFSGVYPFAGTPRTIDMLKGDPQDGGSLFLDFERIPTGIRFVMSEMNDRAWFRGLPRDEVIASLAIGYGDLNFVHPFREGNGRTQRLFWTLALRDAMGRLISWRAEHERGTDSEGKCVKALEAYGIPSETAAALVKQIRGILK